MTTLEMKKILLNYLDEQENGFWSNEELLGALNEGEQLMVSMLHARIEGGEQQLGQYLEKLLVSEEFVLAQGVRNVVLPATLAKLERVRYTPAVAFYPYVHCYRRTPGTVTGFGSENHYFRSNLDALSFYYTIAGNTLILDEEIAPLTQGGRLILHYYKKLTPFTFGGETTLSTFFHTPMIYFALSVLLQKEERSTEAEQYFNRSMIVFNAIIQ